MVHAGIAIAKITEEDEDEAEDLLGITMKEQLKKAKAIIGDTMNLRSGRYGSV